MSLVQNVNAPLTSSTFFLVLSVNRDPEQLRVVRSTLKSVSGLAKTVAFRDSNAAFACTVGIGSNVWDSITNLPRPAELRDFREVKGAKHTAVSTPGDLFFHIISERHDLCFEFERQLLNRFGDTVTVVDETVGFRYFDVRDLLGFVDGTANPVGQASLDSTIISQADDEAAVGGSYVVVQKYLHDLSAWHALSTEQQEKIVGRTKLENIELKSVPAGQQAAHKTLTSITDEHGKGHDILRDNMPFGTPGSGLFGTYFIGYSSKLWVIERMLERMFIGEPPGLHDRILDFSTAVTGTTFFVLPAKLLASLRLD